MNETRPPLLVSAARGACPRCDKPTLFAGIVAFAPVCRSCGLDFSRFNVGDGAASFLIFIVGVIVIGGAMWLELTRSPPWWVHALVWGPLALVLTLGLLRLAKAILLTLEYRHDAAEGKIDQ